MPTEAEMNALIETIKANLELLFKSKNRTELLMIVHIVTKQIFDYAEARFERMED